VMQVVMTSVLIHDPTKWQGVEVKSTRGNSAR
jgi:hypothetical protein